MSNIFTTRILQSIFKVKIFYKYFSKVKSYTPYFPKFSIVGIIGILVNEGLLAVLTEIFNVQIEWAGVVAIESSIINNFLLNNFWTWKNRRQRSFLSRLSRYHSACLISGSINYSILLGLTAIGINHLISNLIGIGLGMVINFLINQHWTFNK